MQANSLRQQPQAAAASAIPQGSYYVDVETAARAVSMATPLIEHCRHDKTVVGSGFLYLVVMNPGLRPLDASFENAVLYEHAFGDPEQWDADYAAFARAKAKLCWTHGIDSYRLQTDLPHLLKPGDPTLWGSTCLDGIFVAASGAFPWFDEVFAGTVALFIRALAKQRHAQDMERGNSIWLQR